MQRERLGGQRAPGRRLCLLAQLPPAAARGRPAPFAADLQVGERADQQPDGDGEQDDRERGGEAAGGRSEEGRKTLDGGVRDTDDGVEQRRRWTWAYPCGPEGRWTRRQPAQRRVSARADTTAGHADGARGRGRPAASGSSRRGSRRTRGPRARAPTPAGRAARRAAAARPRRRPATTSSGRRHGGEAEHELRWTRARRGALQGGEHPEPHSSMPIDASRAAQRHRFPRVATGYIARPWDFGDRPATTISEEMAEEAEAQDLLTLGVEEEYLLVDAVEPRAVEAVEEVFDQVPRRAPRTRCSTSYMRSQIEVASPPQLELRELRAGDARLRTGLADAAERGRRPAGRGRRRARPPGRTPGSSTSRATTGCGNASATSPPASGMSGMHVHVSIPDPETGVQVLNHLRPWLPIFQAATANSPLFAGHDTGYASWRSMLWERWPTVGPTPYLESHEQYETLVADLVASGAMLDEGMLYWYARLSANYPTVEIRMGDVCPTAGRRDAAGRAGPGPGRHAAARHPRRRAGARTCRTRC